MQILFQTRIQDAQQTLPLKHRRKQQAGKQRGKRQGKHCGANRNAGQDRISDQHDNRAACHYGPIRQQRQERLGKSR